MLAQNQSREVFLISKLGRECRRTNFGPVKAMPRNQGRDSMPWNQCGRPDKEIGASASDILGIRESRITKIAAKDSPASQKAFDPVSIFFGVRKSRFSKIAAKESPTSKAEFDAVLVIPYNQPNKAPEPTITSVTIRACARLAPAALVAHL